MLRLSPCSTPSLVGEACTDSTAGAIVIGIATARGPKGAILYNV